MNHVFKKQAENIAKIYACYNNTSELIVKSFTEEDFNKIEDKKFTKLTLSSYIQESLSKAETAENKDELVKSLENELTNLELVKVVDSKGNVTSAYLTKK